MKSIVSFRLLYLFIFFALFCIPVDTAHATLCPPGSNTTGDHNLAGQVCTLTNPIDGPADGDIILNASSVITLGAAQKLIYQPGKKMTIGEGTINIYKSQTPGQGAQIVKITNNICLTDADGDYYPASNAVSARTIGPCTGDQVAISNLKLQNSNLTADANDSQSCPFGYDPPSACDQCVNGGIAPLAAGENSKAVCQRCDGSSVDIAYTTINTRDDEGSNQSALCQKCNGAGAAVNQTAIQDLGNECTTAAAGEVNSCKGPNCDGAGACTYLSGEASQAVCVTCNGASYDPVNITFNTQDTEGSNTCTAECMKCSGGSCIAQNSSQDLFAHCPGTYACSAGLCNGAGACTPDPAGENGLAACLTCNGTSLNAVNVTFNTQDTEGSNLCNTECMKCSGGSCIAQNSSQDLFAHCPGAYACSAGLCSGVETYGDTGTSSACAPDPAGENGLSACQRCNGTSLNAVYITNNTQDTEGSNLCTTKCMRCLSGSCQFQLSSQDLFNQCQTGLSCNGYCLGGAASCHDGTPSCNP